MKQLTHIHSTVEVIKKSTFIAIVAPILSVDDAKEFLLNHSDFSATHNCWAYRIGQVYRFNDDGEPSGTAGKPMYNAIEGQEFDNTAVLVIRHYGGIKLGTGGLMRAYGGGVSRCLQTAEFETIQDIDELVINVPFQYIQAMHNLAKLLNATVISENFNEFGALMTIRLLTKHSSNLIDKATNISKGTVKLLET